MFMSFCVSFFAQYVCCLFSFFFFLMIRRPPRSTLFPYRRSSDLDEALEGEAGELQALARLRSDAERVDEHEVRALGRLGSVVEQRLAGGVHAVRPTALARPGLEHALAGTRHDDVVGAEEALLLVGEE